MKVVSRKKSRLNFKTDTYNLSKAKTYLGRLVEKAGKGEQVFIVRGHRRFILQEVPSIEPIPIPPPGYYANCYTREEIEEDNRLAKASVVRAPKDLE
jgi:hypothetical protein